MTVSSEIPVLIVGGGPSGLILALQLAKHGIRSMMIERNTSTTKWPKMDITNCRSMELFNRLGISKGLKEIGVPENYSLDVIFSTGLGDGGEKLAQWDLESPEEWRERIRSQNDGTMPREPYQRCSQAVFEAWLKPHIQKEPLIESHFGLKFETLEELNSAVESHITNVETGEKHTVRSQYVIGCDGAGSRVRKALEIKLTGGPLPTAMLLVHFKSRDLSRLHRQGRFWHIFFTNGGIIIAQDEVDTWTTHLPISLDTDWESMDPKEAIYTVLGGSVGPYPIEIDEILIKSVWRPNICIAEKYASVSRRVFLSGDSAHQNIPTGGYGMNTAVGDSFDLGWKLAATIKGFGGKHLLESYEIERQPVAVRNIERSGVHYSVHAAYIAWSMEAGLSTLTPKSEAQKLHSRIKAHVLAFDGENKDHGIEMGYRFGRSPIIIQTGESPEPDWNPRNYIPTTWPGSRAPHVYLSDGTTSIFDLFGRDYTIVDFTADGVISLSFVQSAAALEIPLKRLHLPLEKNLHDVWERDVVLIRPDDHVAWRLPHNAEPSAVDTKHILQVATGWQTSGLNESREQDALASIRTRGFTGTVGLEDQDLVKMRAAFQA